MYIGGNTKKENIKINYYKELFKRKGVLIGPFVFVIEAIQNMGVEVDG